VKVSLEDNRLFVLGVFFGSLVGIVIGSVVAMQVGDRSIDLVRRGLRRLTGRREEVRFDLLLQ